MPDWITQVATLSAALRLSLLAAGAGPPDQGIGPIILHCGDVTVRLPSAAGLGSATLAVAITNLSANAISLERQLLAAQFRDVVFYDENDTAWALASPFSPGGPLIHPAPHSRTNKIVWPGRGVVRLTLSVPVGRPGLAPVNSRWMTNGQPSAPRGSLTFTTCQELLGDDVSAGNALLIGCGKAIIH